MNKDYDIIIPVNVLHDKDLPASAKLLYGEIAALCTENGCCWASNSYFGSLYKASNKSVSRWIKALLDKNYITSEIVYKENSKEILHRCIKVVDNLD
ncbi:putative DNA replication protein [Lactobacillus phage phiLdb]|uniref:Putative DNA replication protein n=1 Tax=Lactobacillus phage phiLdb TaxID=1399942 RepID=U3PIY8_9CAUD|nr:replication initiation protein [Lactobacillus phage phiLdb]AGW43715.1 putative DNA replication protein [Lactobacillus phage phiLdb]